MESYIDCIFRILFNTDEDLRSVIRQVAENSEDDRFGLYELVRSYRPKTYELGPFEEEKSQQLSFFTAGSHQSNNHMDPDFTRSIVPDSDSLEKARDVYENFVEKYGEEKVNYYSIFKKIVESFSSEVKDCFIVNYTEDYEYTLAEFDFQEKTRTGLLFEMKELLRFILNHRNNDSYLFRDTMDFLDRAKKYTNSVNSSKVLKNFKLKIQ
jgi:hypothetical protein